MKLRERQGRPAELEQHQIADETDPIDKYQHIEKDRKLELLGLSLEELNAEQKLCVTLFYLEKKLKEK